MNRKARRSASPRKKARPQPIDASARLSSRWLLLSFGVAGLAMAGLYIAIASRTRPPINHTDPQLIDMGRRLYATECASCHGANLEGQENWMTRGANGKLPAPPHDRSGHTGITVIRVSSISLRQGQPPIRPGMPRTCRRSPTA